MKASAILFIVFIMFSMAVTTFEKKVRAQSLLKVNRVSTKLCAANKDCGKGEICLKRTATVGKCKKREL